MINLTGGNIQSQGGVAVPNGSVSFRLNLDAQIVASPNGQIPASQALTFQFDATGNLVQPAQIYSNAELNPQNASGLGTYYLVTFYDANGAQLNKSPLVFQFTQSSGSTVDISKMQPYLTQGSIIYYPPFQTGVTSLNSLKGAVVLAEGPNITITPSGNTLTIAGSGGGSAPGSPSGSLQANNSGAFAAVPNSNVNFTSGAVGLGGSPAAGAILDLQSTTLAFNPPRMTTTQKLAISSPTDGMVVYDTTLHSLCTYDSQSSLWLTLVGQNTPFIASSLNDTFTESTLSSQWTIIGTNSNYSYTLGNGRLTLAGNNATADNLYGIMEPISDPTPWTYVCLLSFQTPYGSTPLCNGIAVGNSSNEYICWGYDSQSELDAVKWNSTTSVAGSLGFLPGNMGNTCYLGIQNDGTNLNFMFSADGLNYMVWGTTPLSSFLGSVTQIGLAIDARTQTACSYQWFRKTQ